MNTGMMAAVLHGKEDVRIEQVPLPEPGPGEVRVRIGAATTCGTDVKVWRRGYHKNMISPPAVFGHEFAGVVDSVGAGVTNWRSGDRVVAANSAPCGECFFCRRGEFAQCEDLLYLNGAYAEYVVVPPRIVRRNLLRIPDDLPYQHAALTEPLACVVNSMHLCPVSRGDEVAIVGDGPIALFFARLCTHEGANVTVIGHKERRLETATRLGVRRVLHGKADDPAIRSQAIRSVHGGRGFDLVIECVGVPVTWSAAISLARKRGVVNLFGGCSKSTHIELATERIHYDELTLTGTYHHDPTAVREALRLLAERVVPGDLYVQAEASLRDLPEVFVSLASGLDAPKVAVFPPSSGWV